MLVNFILVLFVAYIIFGCYMFSKGFCHENKNVDKCYLYVIGLFFMANCVLGMFY